MILAQTVCNLNGASQICSTYQSYSSNQCQEYTYASTPPCRTLLSLPYLPVKECTLSTLQSPGGSGEVYYLRIHCNIAFWKLSWETHLNKFLDSTFSWPLQFASTPPCKTLLSLPYLPVKEYTLSSLQSPGGSNKVCYQHIHCNVAFWKPSCETHYNNVLGTVTSSN